LDKELEHMGQRMQRREEVKALLQPWLSEHEKKEIYHAGQSRGLSFGYLATLDDVLASPQHEAREFFVELDHPVVGKHKYCGAPFKPSITPWKNARAPLLGEHNEEVYERFLGTHSEEVKRWEREGVI
jgi:crotonobetainyl-CoA:carnitine CoA-transferase CaiB-like acyl-CoA transferase